MCSNELGEYANIQHPKQQPPHRACVCGGHTLCVTTRPTWTRMLLVQGDHFKGESVHRQPSF